MCVEHGYAVVQLSTDGVGNLLPLLGEDEELHTASLAVIEVVEREVFDDHGT